MARHIADIMLYGQVEVEASSVAEARSILQQMLGISLSSNHDRRELLLSHPLRSDPPMVLIDADPSIGMIGTRPGLQQDAA